MMKRTSLSLPSMSGWLPAAGSGSGFTATSMAMEVFPVAVTVLPSTVALPSEGVMPVSATSVSSVTARTVSV